MFDAVKMIINDPRIGKEFPLPAYATDGSAAVDLVACIDATVTIAPGKVQLIKSGVSIHVKDPGYAALILPRSGNGHKRGMVLGNGTGLIDSDYQGELMVSVLNRNLDADLVIEPGERIAQLTFVPVLRPSLQIVTSFDEVSERGEGGFGSTGNK